MSPTKIEWSEETWNPVTGCTKVSAGCDHCYAEAITNRFGGPGAFDKIVLHPERLEKPLHWRKPRKVFVNSMSDLFHAEVPQAFIARVFAIMAETSAHTYQVLTKRPGRMRALLSDRTFHARVIDLIVEMQGWRDFREATPWPPPNVWLGTSCEDQATADKRIPVVLDTPAAVRFVSLEPLLGPIDLRWAKWEPLRRGRTNSEYDGLRRLDWVIVGGESGPGARPMDVEWARSIIHQCRSADVPVFVKQGSGPKPGQQYDLPNELWAHKEMPDVS